MNIFEKIFKPKPKEEQIDFLDKKGKTKKEYETETIQAREEKQREKETREEAKKQESAEQLEFLGKGNKIKKEVEEKSIAAAKEQETLEEINEFIESPELVKYREIEGKKGFPIVTRAREFLAAEAFREKLEREKRDEEFIQKAIEALPKAVRKVYQRQQEERAELEEEVKPGRKELFSSLKEKIGGWWKKRAEKKVEKEEKGYEELLTTEHYESMLAT